MTNQILYSKVWLSFAKDNYQSLNQTFSTSRSHIPESANANTSNSSKTRVKHLTCAKQDRENLSLFYPFSFTKKTHFHPIFNQLTTTKITLVFKIIVAFSNNDTIQDQKFEPELVSTFTIVKIQYRTLNPNFQCPDTCMSSVLFRSGFCCNLFEQVL